LRINNRDTNLNQINENNKNYEDFDNIDIDKEDCLASEEKKQLRIGKAMVVEET